MITNNYYPCGRGGVLSVQKIPVGRHVGAGLKRDVYLHPTNDGLVIKIRRKGATQDRNAIEHEYLSFVKSNPLLPRTYGWVETQLGRGLVYERIRDADGQTSATLATALKTGRVTPDGARLLMSGAVETLIRNGILVHDDNLNNFLVQRTGNRLNLVMVDGFGPLVMTLKARVRMYFPVLARHKISRHAQALMPHLEKALEEMASCHAGLTGERAEGWVQVHGNEPAPELFNS